MVSIIAGTLILMEVVIVYLTRQMLGPKRSVAIVGWVALLTASPFVLHTLTRVLLASLFTIVVILLILYSKVNPGVYLVPHTRVLFTSLTSVGLISAVLIPVVLVYFDV